MKNKDIKKLIEDFYNGLTSAEEEKSLKDFFRSSDLPEEWKEEKELFEKYLRLTHISLPEGLEDRLSHRISTYAQQSKRKSFSFSLRHITGIAATLLLMVGLFLTIENQKTSQVADTFTDPAEAAIVAENALIFLSQQLNAGLEQVKEANEEINKINSIIYQQLKD